MSELRTSHMLSGLQLDISRMNGRREKFRSGVGYAVKETWVQVPTLSLAG